MDSFFRSTVYKLLDELRSSTSYLRLWPRKMPVAMISIDHNNFCGHWRQLRIKFRTTRRPYFLEAYRMRTSIFVWNFRDPWTVSNLVDVLQAQVTSLLHTCTATQSWKIGRNAGPSIDQRINNSWQIPNEKNFELPTRSNLIDVNVSILMADMLYGDMVRLLLADGYFLKVREVPITNY